ncbi:MAG TPA: ABC transporter substrate-binding protein [Edaphocola sp.]|nr:ABC transporter substrate-binding protein [Edaphocola sp.]
MKKNILILLASLLAFSLSSCKEQKDNDAVLRIGYLPITDCLPIYVAQEIGLFEKHGLKVDLMMASGGPEVFKELEAGAIDIGFSNVVTLIKQVNAGKAYQSVFGTTLEAEGHMTHAIVCRANEDIKFETANFAINALNNIEELMLLNHFKSQGLGIESSIEKQFKVVPFPQMLAALQNKEVDYACIVEPWITIAQKDPDYFKVIGNYYPVAKDDPALVATYVATKKTISEKKVMVNKFIDVMTEATDFIHNNETAARSFMLKYIKLPEELVTKVAIPKYGKSIEQKEWDKLIKIIYQPDLNINNAFLPKPEHKILFDDIRYRNE